MKTKDLVILVLAFLVVLSAFALYRWATQKPTIVKPKQVMSEQDHQESVPDPAPKVTPPRRKPRPSVETPRVENEVRAKAQRPLGADNRDFAPTRQRARAATISPENLATLRMDIKPKIYECAKQSNNPPSEGDYFDLNLVVSVRDQTMYVDDWSVKGEDLDPKITDCVQQSAKDAQYGVSEAEDAFEKRMSIRFTF